MIKKLTQLIASKPELLINLNTSIPNLFLLAEHLVANGVTVQKWIPVSEPPKEKGCYLVTVNHWLDGKPVTREAFWNSADWLSCEKRNEITPRVTHWMPMPEPPKGGQNELS